MSARDLLEAALPHLPPDQPRYVMGVGTPLDILECAARGVDMFDCVLPTRMARHGSLMTWQGPLKINRLEHAQSDEPLDPTCPCAACQRYSRGYLRHLFTCKEPTAWQLLSEHNLTFYATFMEELRAAIEGGTVEELRQRVGAWTVREKDAVRKVPPHSCRNLPPLTSSATHPETVTVAVQPSEAL